MFLKRPPDLYSFQDITNGFPKTCQHVKQSGGQDGNYYLDPEQDYLDPISVFCNMSSTPVTAVLHHDLEKWTHVHGYERPGSNNAQVGAVSTLEYDNHAKGISNIFLWKSSKEQRTIVLNDVNVKIIGMTAKIRIMV